MVGDTKQVVRVVQMDKKKHAKFGSSLDPMMCTAYVPMDLSDDTVTPRGNTHYWIPGNEEVMVAEKDMLYVRPNQVGIVRGTYSAKSNQVIDLNPEAYHDEFACMKRDNEIYEWKSPDPHLSIEMTLAKLPMFAEELPHCEAILVSHGHKLQMSPRYHCECAGQGIEFDNGRAKWKFRKLNDMRTDGFRDAATRSFSRENLPRGLSAKYERRCRDYIRCYRSGAETMGLEKMRNEIKTHRNMFDSFRTYCKSSDLNDDMAALSIFPNIGPVD